MHFPTIPYFILYFFFLLFILVLPVALWLLLDRAHLKFQLKQEQEKGRQLQNQVEQLRTIAEDRLHLKKPNPDSSVVLTEPDASSVQKEAPAQNARRHIDITPGDIKIISLDEQLIKKAIDLVEQNMANPEFSVEDLSHALAMSRVHLYKKLLAISGKTPIEFIRVIRLKRAAQLLEKSQLTVAEVAYKVGFNNPKYFARYFKSEFGLLPKAFQKKSKHSVCEEEHNVDKG